MRFLALLALIAPLATLPGCAASQEEASAREWQRSECNRIPDADARKRCLDRID